MAKPDLHGLRRSSVREGGLKDDFPSGLPRSLPPNNHSGCRGSFLLGSSRRVMIHKMLHSNLFETVVSFVAAAKRRRTGCARRCLFSVQGVCRGGSSESERATKAWDEESSNEAVGAISNQGHGLPDLLERAHPAPRGGEDSHRSWASARA